MRRSSFNTSASSGVSASGIFRATVVSVGDDDLLKVKIPKLGLNNVYEGVSYAGPTPAAGDVVFVGFLEGKSGSFVAFTGVADSGNTGDPAGDITSVVAGTNLNGGGSSGTVTVNLDSDITLTSVTADEFYGDLHGAIHLQVKNVDSVALSQGDPVYATGAVGASGAIEVQGSSAGSAGTMPAMGLLDQDLAVNGEGDVVVSGVLQNFDTDTPGYSVGDELYVAVSGGLTTTRPSGSSELVQKIGKVIRVQQQTGEILVQGAGRTNDVPNNIVAGGLAIDTDTLYVDATNDRVGIGTTSPERPLHIYHATLDHPLVIESGDNRAGIEMKDGNTVTSPLIRAYGDDLQVNTGGSDNFVIKSDGKVGIGTTSVTTGHILETRGAVLISSTAGVGNSHFPYTDGRFYYTADPETGGTGDHVFRHYSGGSYVEQMRILENGNVGIGTTSPPGHLQVASQNRAVSVLDYGTNNYAELGFTSLGSDGPAFGILSGYHIYFRTGTSRGGLASNMILNSSGNLGVGTVSPGFKLDVNGTINAQSYIRNSSGTNEQLSLRATGTGTRPYLAFYNYNGSSYVRRGYIGYPNAGSSTSTINLVSDSGNVQITGSGGEVNASPKLSINNGPELSDPSSANYLRITTAYGNLDLGPQNTTYCHIYTDRAQFYTNKGFNSVPFLYWRNNSGIGGPLTDTSSTSGYRYVLQNQTYGTFFDYTSIRDRKDQITNVTAEDSGRWIDALQPVTYIERWMGEGEEPDDARAWREADMQVGFIADDILSNSDTDHFSQVLDNGEGGLDPAGWKWECVIAAAVAEIKALRGREAALEARIAALEAQ